MANRPVNVRLVIGLDSTNPDQPPYLMAVPDQFYPILGKITIQWALMEQEAEVLTAALLAANGSSEPGWQKRQFNKRWALMLSEFEIFASGDRGLIKEIKEIDRLAKAAKPIRDGLAHQRIMVWMDDRGNGIRFENENKSYPWSRTYYEDMLATAEINISQAAGRLYRLTNVDEPMSSTLPGKSILQRLPNMGHLRFPMPPARKPRP